MKIKFIDSKLLKDFPSGSAIEFNNDKLYLIGDDAGHILVLNKRWKVVDRIRVFETSEKRIPKNKKADLEAATLIQDNNLPHLLLMGSGSQPPYRSNGYVVNFADGSIEEHKLDTFYSRIEAEGIKELNIEATTVIQEHIIFGNRANNSSKTNHFIITGQHFWQNQQDAAIQVLPVKFPVSDDKQVLGISGLAYSPKNDWLIFTASSEGTDNAYDDGEIGDSYIGVIENASRKIGRKDMKVNEMINLSTVNKKFKECKIESLCIQSEKNGSLKLHLTADNDTGTTTLFKVRVKIS
jgi:hypothetical protein